MKYQKWNIAPSADKAVTSLMDAGYPYLISSVLASRNIVDPEAAAEYLDQEPRLTHSPFLMKDMDKAVERIHLALDRGEKIAVYGDYDVDGITATCLLMDYLKSQGADCERYIPHRIEDGYGLSKRAINLLHQRKVTLLITVDCGITGMEETLYAASLGIDVVITDHHECREVLPEAVAVVDPHRSDCPYPFKHLAGVGGALKLVLALGGSEREDALFARYCALAAIGTVADVMQMSGENRTIVGQGLAAISRTDFVGVHALMDKAGLSEKPLSSIQVGFVLSPRINAAGRMGQADVAADLLLTSDPARAEELAEELCELNRQRQNVEQDIFHQAVELIEEMPDEHKNALVLSSSTWHQGVVGIVASRLSEKYSRPSFMIHVAEDGMGKGSCRSYGGFNLFAALEECRDILENFGGHELAAGFTIRQEMIPAFREKMNEYARTFNGDTELVSSLDVDVCIQHPALVSLAEIRALDMLEPFGSGNTRPVFCLCGATVESLQNIGQNKHLKLRFSKGKEHFDAIYFSTNTETVGVSAGERVDAAFYLQVNEFRGVSSVQLQMIDIRPSLSCSKNEEEALRLCRRCCELEDLSHQEATRLQPLRDQFVRLWQTLSHIAAETPLTDSYLPLLRRLSCATGGNESFLRTVLALQVFSERGLLDFSMPDENTLTLACAPNANKVSLDECPYMQHIVKCLNS